MRDKLLRAVAIFTGYEAVSWFAVGALVPTSQWILAFLMLTAVGLATLLVYLLWLAPSRVKQAPSAPATNSVAPPTIENQSGPSARSEARVRYPSRPDLPLYLLVGGSGAGKSAILRNFLKDVPPHEPRGQASFRIYRSPKEDTSLQADDFVIAEIDGELFEGEERNWTSILRRLYGTGLKKSIRPLFFGDLAAQSELRGVLLVCSLQDLAAHGFFPPDIASQLGLPPAKETSLADPASYAHMVAARLRAIGEIFSAQFPVHVILTHLDSVLYSQSFLSKLNGPELEAPFGAILDIAATDQSTELGAALGQVFQAIALYRVPVLYKTKTPDEKPPAYQYPRELMKLRPGVTSFLAQVFQRFGSSPAGSVLRSVHMTGVRQPAGPNADPHKTFFIADFWPGGQITNPSQAVFAEKLWKDRILPDHFRAYSRAQDSPNKAWKIAFILFGVIAIVCLWGISRSWIRNRELVGTVAEVAESNQAAFATSASGGLSRQLDELDRLRKTIATLTAYGRSHPGMGWGLYQGGVLLPDVRDLYFREFSKALLDPVLNVVRYRFEHLGSAGFVASPETVKNDVRAYQMIHGRACQVDSDFLAEHLGDLWKNHTSETAATPALAFAQFRFYATELKRQDPYNLQPNQQLLQQAQSYLQNLRGMDDVYSAIIAEANGSLKPAQLTDVLDDANERAELSRNYSQGMQGPDKASAAFARTNIAWVRQRIANWKQAGAGDPCIFGKPELAVGGGAVRTGEQELQQKYDTSFVVAWKEFLANSHVRVFSTAKDAVTRLELLAQNRSPLLALFAFVATNTAPSVAPAAANAPSQPAKPDFTGVFRPVWFLVPPGKPTWKSEATDGYIQALRILRDSLQNYVDKPSTDGSTADEVRAAVRNGLNTVDRLKDSFGNGTEGVDHEVERLLKEPLQSALRLVPPPKLPGAEVDQALKDFCAQWQPLLKKFPFNPRSNEEVTSEEFKSIFQPNSGKLWDFVTKRIVVKSAGSTWIAGPALKDLALDKRFLNFFTQMAAISDQFFHNGVLGFPFTIRVVPNPHVKDISFDVNGQDGGSSPADKHFVWPGPNPKSFVLQARGASFAYPGLWSVFRMVQAADARTATGVELSKIKAAGGLEVPLIGDDGKPTKLELTLPDLPGGTREWLFLRLECPPRAIQR